MDNSGFEMHDSYPRGHSGVNDERSHYPYKSSDMESGSSSKGGKCVRFMKDNIIMMLTFLAVVLGFAIGFGLREVDLSDDALTWIGRSNPIVYSINRLQITCILK